MWKKWDYECGLDRSYWAWVKELLTHLWNVGSDMSLCTNSMESLA